MEKREIKFRAWDKEHKRIVEVTHIDLANELGVQVCGGGICMHIDNRGLFEFTGLKDKNGREIFEGDVVREVKPYGDFCHEIRWSIENGGFWVGISAPLNAGESEICEIIGNVWEHPELLNNK